MRVLLRCAVLVREVGIGFAEIDTNHSGSIDFKEFVAWWGRD